MGLPRYLATTDLDDLERILQLADALTANPTKMGGVALLQCGCASGVASQVEELLTRAGCSALPLVVKDRRQAQSEALLGKLTGVSAVWVFADDLFATFLTTFATPLAFLLRARAKEGMPVIGIGAGALALGGLLLAQRVCRNTHFDLVGGLGFAPRVLVDGGADRGPADGALARSTVRSLPGLLGVDLGVRGGLKVDGPRVESVGAEPIVLLGTDEGGRLRSLSLNPGQVALIAPPPFLPFDRGLLSAATVSALRADVRTERPTVSQAPVVVAPPKAPHTHNNPGGGRVCPMCNKVHAAERRLELAA